MAQTRGRQFSDLELTNLIYRALHSRHAQQIHPYAAVVGNKLVVTHASKRLAIRLRRLINSDFPDARISIEYLYTSQVEPRLRRRLFVRNKNPLEARLATALGSDIKAQLQDYFLRSEVQSSFAEELKFYGGTHGFGVLQKSPLKWSYWRPDGQIRFLGEKVPAVVIDIQIGGPNNTALQRAMDYLDRGSGRVRLAIVLHVERGQEADESTEEKESPRYIHFLAGSGETTLKKSDKVRISILKLVTDPQVLAKTYWHVKNQEVFPDTSRVPWYLEWGDLTSASWTKVLAETQNVQPDMLAPPPSCFMHSEMLTDF